MKRLSKFQKAFWLHWLKNPKDSGYHETFVYDLHGAVSPDELSQVFKIFSRDFYLLRCKFSTIDDDLVAIPVEESFQNFKNYSAVVDDLTCLTTRISEEPFELDRQPAWRVGLIQMSENYFRLVIVFHHLILDGSSFDMMRSRISEIYNGLKQQASEENGGISIDDDVDASIIDERAMSYYKSSLPAGRLRLDGDFVGSSGHMLHLDAEHYHSINKFCDDKSISYFRFFSLVYAVFIHKYFSVNNFSIAYPVNMRDLQGTYSLTSLVNMHMLNFSVEESTTALDLIKAVALARRETGRSGMLLNDVVNELCVCDVIEEPSLPNIVFAETDVKKKGLILNGVTVESVYFPKRFNPFDISFEFERIDESFYVNFQIASHVYRDVRFKDILQREICVIALEICKDIHKPISEYQFYGSQVAEKMILSNVLNQSVSAQGRVEDRFYEVASRFPSKVAFVDADRSYTYSELAAKSKMMLNNLAKYIPMSDELVAISVPHSFDLIAVVIALFSLGKAYVPIDVDAPEDYRKKIMLLSGVKHLVTNLDSVRDDINVICVEKLLDVDSHSSLISTNTIRKSKLAYVLFTSGTTGEPKGVRVEHHSIVGLAESCKEKFNLSSSDTFSWFHSFTFDYAVWEIWGALLHGAKLVLVGQVEKISLKYFVDLITEHSISIVSLTPTSIKLLINQLQQGETSVDHMSSVRLLISGGEALLPTVAKQISVYLAGEFYNMFGITEDCVHTTAKFVDAEFFDQSSSLIGAPLPGKVVAVIDDNGAVLPIGAVGELCITGYGVTSGYLNESAEQNQSFCKIDVGGKSLKWFRTGDLVRLRCDGGLEYIGRKSGFINVRGYRVQPRQIEGVINGLDFVSSSVVECLNESLVAFVVLLSDVTAEKINKFIKGKLPAYMVPNRIVIISDIPITKNNKVDVTELERLYTQIPEKCKELNFSCDPIEQQVLEVWKEIIGSSGFGIKDNFFDCGGNSVLLLQLMRSLEDKFNISLSTIDLFLNTTVESMSILISEKSMGSVAQQEEFGYE